MRIEPNRYRSGSFGPAVSPPAVVCAVAVVFGEAESPKQRKQPNTRNHSTKPNLKLGLEEPQTILDVWFPLKSSIPRVGIS